jgi:dihydropyrimidinase
MRLNGWPVTVLSRGRVVIDDGKLQASRGSGAFLQCALSDAASPLNRPTPELAFAAARSGTPLV